MRHCKLLSTALAASVLMPLAAQAQDEAGQDGREGGRKVEGDDGGGGAGDDGWFGWTWRQ